VELLAKPLNLKDVDLDVAYFATGPNAIPSRASEPTPPRTLLPYHFQWQAPAATRPRIPLQLCEFLAYRTALAYEPEERIRNYLEKCWAGVIRFAFFQSAENDKLADAQGYGFVFEDKAFVVFRGTGSDNDWAINRTDAMTDTLTDPQDRRRRKLEARYKDLLVRVGDLSPGRHAGFSIAYASVKHQVESWLDAVLDDGAALSIIYSGHSLGGAMALLAAFDHARNVQPHRVSGVVTFGAPMVGGAAFCEQYGQLLGDRTVLLESTGDIVPRIMQRWYYRMLYPMRQRLSAGLALQLRQDNNAFKPVTVPWRFSQEPPLETSDIDNALKNIREAAEKAAKEAEERAEAKREAREKRQAGQAGQPSAPSDQQSGDKSGGASAVVIWVVLGVFFLVAAGVAWYFVRRKLFAHDIEQRYALYLSTLSYQQLRAKHGGDLVQANLELDEHLRFIRGDLAASSAFAGKKAYLGTVQDVPLRLEIRQDPAFVEYLKRSDTFL